MARNVNIPPEVRKQIRQARDNDPTLAPGPTVRQQIARASANLRRERVKAGGPRHRPRREFNLREDSLVTLTRDQSFLVESPSGAPPSWVALERGTTGILLERKHGSCSVLFHKSGVVNVSPGIIRDASPEETQEHLAE